MDQRGVDDVERQHPVGMLERVLERWVVMEPQVPPEPDHLCRHGSFLPGAVDSYPASHAFPTPCSAVKPSPVSSQTSLSSLPPISGTLALTSRS